MPESLPEFLLPSFESHRNERAYGQRRGYRMEWFTYGDVLAMASQFARELAERKIIKGERVMLWGANSAQWVAAFLGCAMRGMVVVPMDDAATPEFAARVFKQVDAKLLACSRKHLKGAEVFVGVPALALDDFEMGRDHTVSPSTFIAQQDPLQIIFTSGTTSEPKGVVITHANVLANLAPIKQQMQAYLKYERWVHPVRFLNLLPLSHVFGQFVGMFLPPLLGGTVIFQNEFKPAEIVRTVHKERISVIASVPRVLESLKRKIERDMQEENSLGTFRRRFSSAEGKHFLHRWWIFREMHRQFGWKFWAFILGGATLDRETEEFWGRLGYAVIQGYGLTETTSLVSVNHPFRLGKGSIGKVLPGREVKLADDGEILVRGGGVATKYWQAESTKNDTELANQDANRVTNEEGWYRTGDVGALDDRGNLFFKGRKKDVIVTPAGMNIYPEDLERVLREQPAIRDCLVVGVENNGNSEACAVLISREDTTGGHQRTESAIERANESLAEYQRIRKWLEWPEPDFPRTSTQKPHRKLVQEFAKRKLDELTTSTSESTGTSTGTIEKLIASITGKEVSHADRDFNLETDLGLSSLDRVELLGAMEERYQIDLGEMSFADARTIGDLQKLLRGQGRRGENVRGADVRGEDALRTQYHYPRWTLSWPVRWIRTAAHYLLMRPAMALLGWPRIDGRKNLRGWNGPLLVVSNHVSDVDVGFIQVALPARFRQWLATATGGEALEALRTPKPNRGVVAKKYDQLKWTLGVALLNLFPLPREAGFRKSFTYAGEAVDRGYSVLVFPEGRHTTDGKMLPFRGGIGLLAVDLGIPVLPIRIDGLYEVKSAGEKFAAPGKIKVRIGKPIRFESGSDPRIVVTQMQEAIEGL